MPVNGNIQLPWNKKVNFVSDNLTKLSNVYICYWWLVELPMWLTDGFFGHFFWKVEGSSAHTRESRATHVCHVQLTCGKLLYGGGEPSHVAHMCHVWNVWQLTYMLLLYGGGEPSCVAHVCHVWQLTCMLLLYGGGEPSRVAHVCHMWQLTCMLLLYGGGGPHMWLTCVTCVTCGN